MTLPSSHVSFERLTDLVEGRLTGDEQAGLQNHLATCPRCAANLVWLKRVVALMRSDESEDAPPALIARALRLFRSRLEQAAHVSNHRRRRLLASLRFDSARPSLALGLRAGQAETRQQLYSAGEQDLDLRLNQAGQDWAISGQVLGPAAGGLAELRGQAIRVQAPLNDLSEFALPPVPAGRYALILHLAEVEIEVTDLEVGIN